jgi:hypothetical protein
MRFRVVATSNAIIDGQTVAAGDTLATIETNLPIGNVLSGATFGAFAVLSDAPANCPVIARVELAAPPPMPTETPTTAEPTHADQIDALNAADAEAEAAEAAAGAVATEPTAPANAAEFDGLDVRITKALQSQGFGDRAAVAKFVADGGDLVELDEIGKVAKDKILAWLNS